MSAFYVPAVQKWVNRDPIAEDGGVNLYAYVQNTPINDFDPLGLKLWKCTRPTKSKLDASAQHVYLWDDTTKSSCGRGGGNPFKGKGVSNPGDTGPDTEGHTCVEIPGSEGKEASTMACCNTPKGGLFVPGKNDCHNWIDDCLLNNGLSTPQIYGRVYGPTELLWDYKRTIFIGGPWPGR